VARRLKPSVGGDGTDPWKAAAPPDEKGWGGMKLLVVVISEHEQAQDVRNALLKLGVRGVSLIHGLAMPGPVGQEPPLFGGIRRFLADPTGCNRILFGIVDSDDILNELDGVLRSVSVNLSAPGAGYAFTLPVEGIVEAGEEDPPGQRRQEAGRTERLRPFPGDRR
jgi:hypothetical protein